MLNLKISSPERRAAPVDSSGLELIEAAQAAGYDQQHDKAYVTLRSADDGKAFKLKTCSFCGNMSTQLQGCARCKSAYYCKKEWYVDCDPRRP